MKNQENETIYIPESLKAALRESVSKLEHVFDLNKSNEDERKKKMRVYELISLLADMPAGYEVKVSGTVDLTKSSHINNGEYQALENISDVSIEGETVYIEW